ncbi:multicopper oxidase family protein [Mycobacterium sp.]|uniref:multicopper oxidase family protein n=1 Tax=Mycobacterium sp. TaxID=1785 RepID=UPI003C754243
MLGRRHFLMLSAVSVAAACSRTGDPAGGKAVDVALTAGETDLRVGGLQWRTWAYDGQVPAKEIRLRKGQTLRAAVTNNLPADTSVHWHGLAIPNPMDGVPPLTQQPIAAGQRFTYEFVVPDSGTYWFHSHVGTQLDRGLYGPLIIEDPDERADYDDELALVLDDWIDGTGTNPDKVFEQLQKTGMPSMGPMGGDAGVTPTTPLGDDGGDVTYPYYLINGRIPGDPQTVDYRAGQRVRLRIINAGSDTAFRVGVPNTKMAVTHTDGFPVIARDTDSVVLGMGERVDATVTVNSSVPVIAAAERKDGYAQLNLRANGTPSNVNVEQFVTALRNSQPLDTATLSAAPEVQLPQRKPDQTFDLRLAGPVPPYTWTINGQVYDPTKDGLPVKPGQRVQVRYINESKMFHPMHLHGHTFQVMSNGRPMARKDTVLVPPLATVDTVFDANNPGKWIDHCHNTYHLESGMAVYFTYT